MKIKESTAWDCRWFNVVAETKIETLQDLGELEVLADFSESDYQGDVRLAFLDRDGRCCYLQYGYGSCSECDSYEDMSEDEIRADIFQSMVVMDKTAFIKFAASHSYLKTAVNDLVLRLFN